MPVCSLALALQCLEKPRPPTPTFADTEVRLRAAGFQRAFRLRRSLPAAARSPATCPPTFQAIGPGTSSDSRKLLTATLPFGAPTGCTSHPEWDVAQANFSCACLRRQPLPGPYRRSPEPRANFGLAAEFAEPHSLQIHADPTLLK